jgi:hypothetical protein
MGVALERHDEILRGAFAASGGFVFATGGDGLVVSLARWGRRRFQRSHGRSPRMIACIE